MIPLWGYLAVTIPLVVTPGASTAVVLRNSIADGTRAGVVTAIGINTGSFVYGLLSAFGFALALQRWPSAWTLLRVAGFFYLGWLGIQSLRKAATAEPALVVPRETALTRGSMWHHLYEGFVTNALNPAIATFYLVLLPQFIPRGAPIVESALVLTAIHISLAATWHITWAAAGGTLARTLAIGRSRRVLEAATGVALVALALKIALSR